MSLKDLFNREKSGKILESSAMQTLAKEIESEGYVNEFVKEKTRFLPKLDYSDPKNFAKFGSAEKYYEDSLRRVFQTFPYDGSSKERTEWFNNSRGLDLYIFENEYPRTHGYVRFSAQGWGSAGSKVSGYGTSSLPEYIFVKGGPHVDNIYHTASSRESNLKLNGTEGNTVEFWLKKAAFVPFASSEYEVIFDAWVTGAVSSSHDYARMTLELSGNSTSNGDPSPFYLTYMSGTAGFAQVSVGDQNVTTASIADNAWHHYAVSVLPVASGIDVKFYIDGNLNHSFNSGSTVAAVNHPMVATIGSLITTPSGNTFDSTAANLSYGKLSASMDEFRFWKVARTSREIGRHWFTQVAGGTNTDKSNTELGVYYKFNEGITGTSSVDSVVLDYAGRLSNGDWTGYNANAREVGTGSSAMISSSASVTEFADPIMYEFHPDVQSKILALKTTGSFYDNENNAAIYNSFPDWIRDEDRRKNKNLLWELSQIIASYFDTLFLQIEALPKLKKIQYDSFGKKPLPFADKLLESHGLLAPEIFLDATILEQLANRNEDKDFEQKLYNVKNLIYQNIYNNLVYIFKTKGTEKSFRNLIRCFGIDDEILKLNAYGNNVDYDLKENFRNSVIKHKYVNFNTVGNFGATIFQSTGASDYPCENSLLSDAASNGHTGLSFTTEASVLFAKKPDITSNVFYSTDFLTSSLFGAHAALSCSTDYTFVAEPDSSSFQVFSARDKVESPNVKFILTSSLGGYFPTLTSSLFQDVYDNQRWNLSVRLRPLNYPFGDFASGALSNGYNVEFHGVQTILDEVINKFTVTGAMTADRATAFFNTPRRFYIGAHRTNYTGSVLQSSDARVSSFMHWRDYLTDAELRAHARNPQNFGRSYPFENFSVLHKSIPQNEIPKIDALALNWDFNAVTASDSRGQFDVVDFSSGSTVLPERYGLLSEGLTRNHPGLAKFFVTSSTAVVKTEFLSVAKQQLPETVNSNNMVDILKQDDDLFTRETRPVSHFFAFEKSMYQTISEEMLNFFATIVDFNNLIGDPVNRYRQSYKALGKLRSLFFERVQNTPDVDKYIDYYKWFDGSLNTMLQQLIPASARFASDIRTVIESHVLERNKYWTKFPTLEFKTTTPEAAAAGIGELGYSWKSGSAPIPLTQSLNPVWWKQRAERDNTVLSSSNFVNANKNTIRRIATTNVSGSTFALRNFNRSYRVLANRINPIVSGNAFKPITSGAYQLAQAVNVENKKRSTSSVFFPAPGAPGISSSFGNYFNDYEIVQTSGRSINNRYFVNQSGLTASLVSSSYVSGVLEYAKPARDSHKHVIVERFSAPGGPETAGDHRGGFGLDIEAAEFSRFNSLNLRNLSVRQPLNLLSAERCERFGIRSGAAPIEDGYKTAAAFHKTNRNARWVPRNVGNDGVGAPIAVCRRKYDNWFVQHQIPQSDLNYAWISASTTASKCDYNRFDTDLTVPRSSTGSWLQDSVVFVSASNFVSVNNAGTITFGEDKADTSNADLLHTDFVGLNHHVVSYVTASENHLGLDAFLGITGAANTTFITLGGEGSVSLFNAYLLNHNGPYQYPSWKQVRNGYHPVVRAHRANNIISLHLRNGVPNTLPISNYEWPTKIQHGRSNDGSGLVIADRTIKNFTEAPVSSRYKPVLFGFQIEQDNPVFIQSVYGNNLGKFATRELNDRLGLGSCQQRQVQEEIFDLIRNDRLPSLPGTKFVVYSETVFPRDVNVFLAETRARQVFDFAPWRQVRVQRQQTDATNSQGITIPTSSIWPLDMSDDSTTSKLIGGVDNFDFGERGEGELQNDYSLVTASFDGTNEVIHRVTASATYARRYLAGGNPFGGQSVYLNGASPWDAPTQAGKQPFTVDYGAYRETIRRLGKDFALVPEFRISEHMEFFMETNSGDFLADRNSLFEITGATAGVFNSSHSNFYTTYSHSDFLKYFDIVKEDSEDIGQKESKLTLTCKAYKRFLPYDGAYPVLRTKQLAELFSSSYEPVVRYGLYNGPDDINPSQPIAENRNWRMFLTPFFAPGIMYNTVKSGIAVDYPNYINETINGTIREIRHENNHTGFARLLKDFVEIGQEHPGYCIANTSDGVNSGFNVRVPFEAIVNPSLMLNTPLYDNEPHTCSVLAARTSNRGLAAELTSSHAKTLYERASNNFFAASIDFFLEDGELTAIRSINDDSPSFGEVLDASKNYKMIVSLISPSHIRNAAGAFADSNPGQIHVSGNMYNRPQAFGPPVLHISGASNNAGFAPFTPSYYDGFAEVEILFNPAAAGKFTAAEILAASSVIYRRFVDKRGNGDYDNSANGGNNLNGATAMQISASLNLFDVVKTKRVDKDDLGRVELVTDQNAGSIWTISTKFETPILNFDNAEYPRWSPASAATDWTNVPTIGMWHQLGAVPADASKGVFLELRDETGSAGVESLADLVGMRKGKTRVGKLAKQKKIYEAVVAVPFVVVDGIRKFVPLNGDREVVNQVLRGDTDGIPDSITSMIVAMQKYVIPPRMNFVHFDGQEGRADIKPFVMYFFEFSQEWTQEDVSHFWQNLPPSVGDSYEEQTVSHSFLGNEILGTTYPEKLRWMVFKVKQKASNNYFGKTEFLKQPQQLREISADANDKEKDFPYSYNWPYDYFSIVELIKLDAEVEMKDLAPSPQRIPGTSAQFVGSGGGEAAPQRIPGQLVEFIGE